jgi:hypothetical protein
VSTIISRDFTLEEFQVSQTAVRHNIDMSMSPQVKTNVTILACVVLQRIRDAIESPLMITSGYRPRDLNSLIGGSENSAHMLGCAADVRSNKYSSYELCELVMDLDLPFDQVINEFGEWMHVSIPNFGEAKPRKQVLTAERGGSGTIYHVGLLA